MITCGCDPDTHTLAVAVLEGRRLVWWAITDIKRAVTGGDAVVAVARALEPVLAKAPRIAVESVAVEQMNVYPGTTLGKGGVDGLMRVASAAGVALYALLDAYPDAHFAMPTAPEWKGQVPKSAHHPQILARLDQLSVEKLASVPASLRGHLMDAVGLAQWASNGRTILRADLLASAKARARRARG